jgi:hypothetical protein
MRGHRIQRLVGALLVAAPSTAALAHAFWIEPSRFDVKAGESVTFRLRVGLEFDGDDVPRHPAHLRSFDLRSPAAIDRAEPVAGVYGLSPAGFLRFPATTPYVVTYVSAFTGIQLPPAKFAQYVEEEGLVDVAATHPTGDAPVRERFARYAKTLLVPTTTKPGAALDARAGLRLELVCESKALAFDAVRPSRLAWRLWFDGRPFARHRVVLERKDAPSARRVATTDADGRVSFPVEALGFYRVRAIVLLRSDDPAWDWESHWASTTFEVRPAAPAGRRPLTVGSSRRPRPATP